MDLLSEEASGNQRHDPGAREDESEKERLDRNLTDLLAEVRVALPGVQVLFAFLLILPFQTGFENVTETQRAIYFATLLLTAVASVLLIAPSARHRLRFRKGDKRWVVMTANQLSFAGLACLGLAITGAIVLVSDFIFSVTAAISAGAGILALLSWIWFAAPLMREVGGFGANEQDRHG